jgi:L-methionine (R)-S-oxide reductase
VRGSGIQRPRKGAADAGDAICRKLDRLRAQGAGVEALLSGAVRLLHDSNSHFHWTGIYELFPDGYLRLGPFIGAPTDHVFICVGQGICGTAVAQKRNINVPDVSKADNYLPCSAATKSELVVLIREGERIFAQIDIDSHDLDAFDPATVTVVEKVAAWLAELYSGGRRDAGRARAAGPGA